MLSLYSALFFVRDHLNRQDWTDGVSFALRVIATRRACALERPKEVKR